MTAGQMTTGAAPRPDARGFGAKPSQVKAACNRAHARRRAKERYGLDLTNADLDAMASRLAAGGPGAVPIRRDAHRNRGLYAVRESGRWLPAIYCGATGTILSFLPERVLDPYLGHLDPTPRAAATPAEPFVPRVLGRTDIAPAYPEADPPPATIAEATERRRMLAEFAERVRALIAGRPSPWERRALDALRVRAEAECRQLRQHVAASRNSLDGMIAGDPAGALGHLAAALGVFKSIARRVGHEAIEPGEQAAIDAIRNFLQHNGPLVDAEAQQ